MGFIRRILGSGQPSAAETWFHSSGIAETGDGIVWVYSLSPNERFAVLVVDASDHGEVGYRTGGAGRYRVVEKDGGIRCEGRLERPNDAHVANDGTFVVADWLFTEDLTGRFFAIGVDGHVLVKRECGANILATYIEDDGRFCAVHLARNPDDPEEDERFALYELPSGVELWSKALEVGRPDRVKFEIPADALWVTTETFGRTRFGLRDGSVDLVQLRDRALLHADGFEVLRLVQEEVSEGIAEGRRALLVAACERASGLLTEYPNYRAKALRIAGELVEATDEEAALTYWERALAVDPKVGIATRARTLRERLNPGR